jgi:7-cyano-7-deazaguanine synthase in queuosine biosynthesis
MTAFEFRPAGADAADPGARQIEWPIQPLGAQSAIILDVDPFLSRFGQVPEPAVDFSRVAIGAYLADRLVRRSMVSWSRDITLMVHLIDPGGFQPAVEPLTLVLGWVTGDAWTVVPLPDRTTRSERADAEMSSHVCLASGGLDSLCGALLAPEGTVLLGHRDNKTVAHAQGLVRSDLEGRPYQQIRVGVRRPNERSSRSRSVMFAALGAALAGAKGSENLIIPENGFTSLNPPLTASRGGPHTTRSTHPTTIAYLNAVIELLGIGVTVANPYQWLTKGELIKRTAEIVGSDRLEDMIPHTFSCATGNTQFFKGGSAFQNCGVCVACMTRRGAIRMSGLVDKTEYTIDNVSSDVRTHFLAERGRAVSVVTALRGWRPDIAKLISMGPFPDGFDYDRAADLLDRGLGELTLGLPRASDD